jgi:acyl carrier protein
MIDKTQFLAWCGTLFNEPAGKLSYETLREDIEGWDSMGSLLLMADLDEMYDIQLDEGELSSLITLGDLAKLIETRTAPED